MAPVGRFHSLVTVVVALTLTGACSAQGEIPYTDQPTGAAAVPVDTTVGATQPRPTSSAARKGTLTSTHTPTSIPTPAFTGTPLPPAPPRSVWKITDDFFFGESPQPDCQLPCWQGLTIGVSKRDGIQNMFDTIFGFNGTRDFFPDNLRDNWVPGLYTTEAVWYLTQDPFPSFMVRVWVEKDTSVLHSLDFEWGYGPFNIFMTSQRIIRELGKPSVMLISIQPTMVSSWASFTYLIIYEQGLMFFANGSAPMSVVFKEGEIKEALVEFCLGGDRWRGEKYGGQAIITDPVPRNLEGLSSFQEWYIHGTISEYQLAPVQESLGISIDELVQLALTDQNACIYIDVTDHFTN